MYAILIVMADDEAGKGEVRNEISGSTAGPTVQAGSVHGDVVLVSQSSARSSAEEPAELAGYLAGRVQDLSRREDEHRRIHDPRPLPVQWHTAAEDLFDHWANIHGQCTRNDPMPLDGGFTSIRETYEAVRSERLMILGRAGAGKTVLAHRLILALLEDRSRTGRVPVLFSLSDWDPRSTGLREWLVQQLLRDHPFLDKRDRAGNRGADVLAKNGWILPVLDGFDEIPERYRRHAVNEISLFAGPLIVTSRPEEYTQAARDARALGRAAAIELDDLTLDEASTYLQASTGKTRTPEWDAVFDHLRNTPNDLASQNLAPVLKTPLMVMLARTTYNDLPDHHPGELLDTARFSTREDLEEHLLGAYLDTLYDPRRKTGQPEDPAAPKWNPERARSWLGYLATHLTARDTHDLTWWQLPNTLHGHTRILTVITTLGLASWIAVVLPRVLPVGIAIGLTDGHVIGPTDGLAFGLMAGLAIGLINEVGFSRGRAGREPERLRPTLRRRGNMQRSWLTFLKKAASEFPVGLAMGLAIGIALGLADALQYGLADRLVVVFAAVLVFGLAIGLVFGLVNVVVSVLGDSHDPRDAITPWQLLTTDRTVTLVRIIATALAVGSFIVGSGFRYGPGLGSGVTYGPGLGYGLTYGLVAGIVRLGLSAWGSWLLFARLWLPLTGRLPWRPKRFLEDAYQRGVLRQAGAVYQFRHAQLRDHLARQYRARSGRR